MATRPPLRRYRRPVSAATKGLGLWSMTGTWALMVVAGLSGEGFATLWRGLELFFTGAITRLPEEVASPGQLISVVGATVAVALPLALAIGQLVNLVLGKADHVMTNMFGRSLDEKPIFPVVGALVLLEELFARWLILGVIGHWLDSPAAMYGLFIFGNTVWALVHLYNYTNPAQRHSLRVLSQFVTGIFFTIVFLQYGFMAVLLTHLAFNCVIFAAGKVMRWSAVNVGLLIYYASVAVVSVIVMTAITQTDLSAAAVWLQAEPVYRIPGWGIMDYVMVATLVMSLIGLASELLAYDAPNLSYVNDEKVGPIGSLLSSIVGAIVIVALVLAVFAVLGVVMSNEPHQIIVTAFLFLLLARGVSGSAAAKSFWTGLPSTYISLCCLLALGFWGGVMFLLIRWVIQLPEYALSRQHSY